MFIVRREVAKTIRTKAIDQAKLRAKERDSYTCQKNPNHTGQMHGSHIIPVGAGGIIAADPDNIITLCASCHKLAGDSWHEAPLEQQWFHKKFPGRYDRLKAKHETRPIKKYEWQEIYDKLKVENET